MMKFSFALALTIACLISPVTARENEAWEATPPEIRKWYYDLKRPDEPLLSCCGEADGYWADSFEIDGDKYVAIITDTRDVPNRPTIKPGTKIVVPNSKIKWDQSNPTGHGVIFVKYDEEAESFSVYCYCPPGGV